jgi:thioredoxin-dependent peroxiredoxin
MATIQAGERAPDFSLPTDTGETVRLADLAGKYVVLFFFVKANTPG